MTWSPGISSQTFLLKPLRWSTRHMHGWPGMSYQALPNALSVRIWCTLFKGRIIPWAVCPFLLSTVKYGMQIWLHYCQVITSIISELTFAQNSWSNLFPLACSICMFAMKAHHSLYWIGSWLGQNMPYNTVQNALIQMAVDQHAVWATDHQAGVKNSYIIILDNIQVYSDSKNLSNVWHFWINHSITQGENYFKSPNGLIACSTISTIWVYDIV